MARLFDWSTPKPCGVGLRDLVGVPMKTVYIASPYTVGDVAANVRKSIDAADKLLDLGFVPFVPLLSHFWHLISPKPHQAWMALDFEWVTRCDYLLRLPGESKGADEEVAIAIMNIIPVCYSISELLEQK